MKNRDIENVSAVIDYIEAHLDSRLDLDTIARAANYSRYHLHRMFTSTTGITPHDYILRRRLTRAARLLRFSDEPILDIALLSGYESRQSFTSSFREMYKMTPARFRKDGEFYPLLMKFTLHPSFGDRTFAADDICIAGPSDIPGVLLLSAVPFSGRGSRLSGNTGSSLPCHRKRGSGQDFSSSLKAGVAYAFSHRSVRRLLILYGCFVFLCVPAGFLSGLLVSRVYGGTYGYLTSAELAGFAGMTPVFPVYLLLMFLYGIALTVVQTTVTTLLQECADFSFQGRIFGLLSSMYSGFLPLGMAVFGPLSDQVPLQWIMIVSGIVLICMGFSVRKDTGSQ